MNSTLIFNYIFYALVGALLLAILYGAKNLFARIRAFIVTKAGRSPFETKSVMNRGEHELYLRLLQAVPQGALVLAQVQLSSFLQVRGLTDQKERWQYLNRIIRLSVDFLIVDAKTMAPLIGIELDGPSHRGAKSFIGGQIDADARKDQAFKAAGVALLRIPVKNNLGTDGLRERLRVVLQGYR